MLTLHGHSGTVRALAWPDQVAPSISLLCVLSLQPVAMCNCMFHIYFSRSSDACSLLALSLGTGVAVCCGSLDIRQVLRWQ